MAGESRRSRGGSEPGVPAMKRDQSFEERRVSFRFASVDYDRTRPGYPSDGIAWALGTEPKSIVDLGCGPGNLARQLVELGHAIVGVDPSLKMLQGMKSKALPAVCGNAEEIPLRSNSFDVVTAAQAFHWFDPSRALPEIGRVLRDGGRIALFWNIRDDSVDWLESYRVSSRLRTRSARASKRGASLGTGSARPCHSMDSRNWKKGCFLTSRPSRRKNWWDSSGREA